MYIHRAEIQTTIPDATEYLEQRRCLEHLKAVEFGHGVLPIAFKHPTYTGNRYYIGVETWFRGCHPSLAENFKDKTTAKLNGDPVLKKQNITLIHHQPGGEIIVDPGDIDRPHWESWYNGPYDPRTELKDGVANEVFVSNVFNDPHTANSRERSQLLLFELARVVSDEGVVILRETITPDRFNLTDEMIHDAGLFIAAKITPEMVDAWEALQQEFAGENWYSKDSFYLFLKRSRATL